jgi:HAD superfamily hydrolase (TIGR01484 family)
MKKQYKAIMLDVDGTTVVNHPDALPSKKVQEAIKKAAKKLKIGAVTGRPFFALKPVADLLPYNSPLIVSGGAQIIDTQGSIIWEKKIPKEDTAEICKLLKKYDMQALIQEDGDKDVHYSPSYSAQEAISIAAADLTAELADELIKDLKPFKDLSYHKIVGWTTGTTWVQINHAQATKQHAILSVAELLGIQTQEIIGVGDGYNDFPLLMACGLKVAMGNAVPELKEIADYVAPPVEDDGLVNVIERYIL